MVEDDDLMADLLETVVSGLNPAIRVSKAHSVGDAKRLWESMNPKFFIVDWMLPDGSGLALLRDIRAKDKDVPVVMITARADRDSILKAAHYGISGYISKPFDVELLHGRLVSMIGDSLPDEASSRSLPEMLAEGLDSGVHIPGNMDVAGILALIEEADQLSGSRLAERWQKEVALSARLLEVANRSSFRRSGAPVTSVRDAISVMGVPMALNQGLALALDVGTSFTSGVIRSRALEYHALAEAVACEAQKIAAAMGKRGRLFQTAGLLSRMGELAVLSVMDRFVREGGGSLSNADIEQALEDWAQPYGNRLKVQWRLPLDLRQLIGAVHHLSRENVTQQHLVMRGAALLAGPERLSTECERLMRQLGLEAWFESLKAKPSGHEESDNDRG
ncbi:response regulator [Marinobacter salinexigens]|uniref:Response regulator n=1 Tax=Marinobacter salinexigens TaxID=2919747 RepID=A0A5B0V9U0_9GAMM|nr:response regulator [Marinobacter salinexigens]